MDMSGLPLAFGKSTTKKKDNSAAKIEQTKRVSPPPPTHLVQNEPQAGPSSVGEATVGETFDKVRRAPESDDEDEDDEDEQQAVPQDSLDLPVSHEVIMKDHSKTVSALSLDPSGTRVVSGSYDYDCKLWDFGGMNSSFRPFRSWECTEGHQVTDVKFSNTGDSFLAATASTQVKLFSRDGAEIQTFNKGDMYIRDLRHTDGHVAGVSQVAWHPKKNAEFLTASADSTIRLWDVENKRKSKSIIVVKSKERGGKTKVTATAWSADGRTIGGACEDGALHLWAASSNFARPNSSVEGAHEKETWTGSIAFTKDGRQLASRGGDGTVKLWDCRSFKKPLFVASGLPTLNAETDLCFSPDDKYILTGTAGSKAGVLGGDAEEARAREIESSGVTRGGGKVVVMEREGLNRVREINVSSYSVVRTLWHPQINQIVTGSADGSIHVLYSPLTSLKGATLAVTKAPKARQPDDFPMEGPDRPIIAPHSLPMYRDDPQTGGGSGGFGGKRKREKERHDPQKTLKPTPPMNGPGRGGRVGAAATQHLVKGIAQDYRREEDPREALLKYATKDVNDNTWTAAWTQSAPKPVFDLRPDLEQERKDEEERKKEEAKAKRRK